MPILLVLCSESGHQPLSWTARTQIALDAARGIEYIHDHTKARYVHRDIKTSNILLDETLRAKVYDNPLPSCRQPIKWFPFSHQNI